MTARIRCRHATAAMTDDPDGNAAESLDTKQVITDGTGALLGKELVVCRIAYRVAVTVEFNCRVLGGQNLPDHLLEGSL